MFNPQTVKKEDLMALRAPNGDCGFTEQEMESIEKHPYTMTVKGTNGEVLACVGVVKFWENRGEFWVVIAKNCGAKFVRVHRAVSQFIDNCPLNRLEASTEVDAPTVQKWAVMLGFKVEAVNVKAYYASGKNANLFARVNSWPHS